MAATNFTPIQLYFSTTASAVPLAANLAQGELAINITDGKLYYEDNAGAVQVIATKGAGTIGGSTTQIQYNNAGALAGNAAMVFNNSTNVTTLTTLNLTNALGAIYGGTAQSTYTQGDILYSSASNTLAKLGIGANTYILTSTGSIPQWVAPSSIAVLTATNLDGGAAGSVPYQSGVATTTFLAIGTANRVMTSTGTAPQWVTSLTGLTGVSSSSITNTSLTSGRVVVSSTAGLQADDADLTFDGTTLSAGGFSTVGLSTLVKTVKIGDSSFNGVAVFAAATPAKLYMGTGTVTDVTSAISATNAIGAIASLGITPIAATNTSVTYTDAATLYIAGAPSAGTNITITNPYSLYVAAGAAYFGGAVTVAGSLSLAAVTVTSLTDSGLTSGRVTYAGTGGLLQDSANLTFSGTQLSVTGILSVTGSTSPLSVTPTGNAVSLSVSQGLDANAVRLVAGGNVSAYLEARGYVGVKILADTSTIGNFTSSGLAVTGALSLSGNITQTGANPLVAQSNSGFDVRYAMATGNGAYSPQALAGDAVVASLSGRIVIAPGAASTAAGIFSTTGLAVTGALSATGTLSGGTSGTGYSFSGSAPATSLTLDASGNLVVGNSTASQKFQVERNWDGSTWGYFVNTDSGSGAAAGILMKNNTGDLGAISLLSSANSPANALFIRSLSTNPLVFGTSNTERARFNSTGALVFAGGTTTADGIGITFPATQSASSDANTLDDYEEGTVSSVVATPDTGTITLNASSSIKYTKIGRVVTYNGFIEVSSVSSPTGNVYFTGAFTSAGPNTAGAIAVTGNFNSFVGYIPVIRIQNTQSTIYLQKTDETTGTLNAAAALLKAGSTFEFQISILT